MLTVLPFSGFYNTVHEDTLDRALESMFSDEDGEPVHEVVARASLNCHWHEVFRKYAAAYCDAFASEFELNLTFESLNSPKEYNFMTDRIFAHVMGVEDVRKRVPDKTLGAVAIEMFTSRSGFISYYRPDWTTWGPLKEWDHNQVFALLTALVRHEKGEDGFDESRIMEYLSCNGAFEAMIGDHIEGIHKIHRVHEYLLARRSGPEGIRHYRDLRRKWASQSAVSAT